MIFKTLVTYTKEINQKKRTIIRRVADCSCYFKSGLYVIDCATKIIYKFGCRKYHKLEQTHTLSGVKSIKNKHTFFHSFLSKRIVRFKNKKRAANTYIIGILSYDHVIFLDPKNEKVLTHYDSPVKRNDVFNRRQLLLKEHFNLPHLLVTKEQNKNIIEEKYIKKQDYDPEKGFCSLLDFYIKKEYCDHFKMDAADLDKLFSLTQRKLDNAFTCLLSSKCLQQIVSHGDCNYFNYIFDGESFFFIDYDRAGTHFFFCDCFFYIFWQYYILNDSSLIENCLNGKYDCLFTSLFERFDAQYNNKFIYIYILLTIYDVSDWEGNIDMINSLERLATKYDEKQ